MDKNLDYILGFENEDNAIQVYGIAKHPNKNIYMKSMDSGENWVSVSQQDIDTAKSKDTWVSSIHLDDFQTSNEVESSATGNTWGGRKWFVYSVCKFIKMIPPLVKSSKNGGLLLHF